MSEDDDAQVRRAAARGRSSMTPGDQGEWPEGADPDPEPGARTADAASVDAAGESPQGDAAGVKANATDPAPGSSEATPASGSARDA